MRIRPLSARNLLPEHSTTSGDPLCASPTRHLHEWGTQSGTTHISVEPECHSPVGPQEDAIDPAQSSGWNVSRACVPCALRSTRRKVPVAWWKSSVPPMIRPDAVPMVLGTPLFKAARTNTVPRSVKWNCPLHSAVVIVLKTHV